METMTTYELIKLTGVSMGIVFTALYAICLMLQGFEYVFYRPTLKAQQNKANEAVAVQAAAPQAVQQNEIQELTYDQVMDDDEALAVALLANALASEGSNKRMHIKSIKRIY